VSARGF